jgi:hypothetical protein
MLYTFFAVTALLMLPLANVAATTHTLSAPFGQVTPSQSNGCSYDWAGYTCVEAVSTYGGASQTSLDNPIACGPFPACTSTYDNNAYVMFDASTSYGDWWGASGSGTVYLTIDAQFLGIVYATGADGLTDDASAALQYNWITPTGTTEYIVVLSHVTLGTQEVYSYCNGNMDVACPYTISVNIPSAGDYYLGGGFATDAFTSVNSESGSGAAAIFYPTSQYPENSSYIEYLSVSDT